MSARAAFTSGASYSATNWDLSTVVTGKIDKTDAVRSFGSINADGRLRAPVAGVADTSVKALINTQFST